MGPPLDWCNLCLMTVLASFTLNRWAGLALVMVEQEQAVVEQERVVARGRSRSRSRSRNRSRSRSRSRSRNAWWPRAASDTASVSLP